MFYLGFGFPKFKEIIMPTMQSVLIAIIGAGCSIAAIAGAVEAMILPMQKLRAKAVARRLRSILLVTMIIWQFIRIPQP